ncbi:MAG TPA: hypothetical protein PLR20_12220 [Syntrophales bacterium]|nr:hypothetical protein [Syntrophales bacterium]HOX94348.1 hypothetical protein [Syntrophales bacterium]HPI57093.1 hypothetical protein [Syntrophales bacterium]HPN24820.1 hypothetical protein [Syntrophales bacterium]HQM30107.1 hypothetical protein [Syntrophales bacterium]
MSETAGHRHFIRGMTELIIAKSHTVASHFMHFAVDNTVPGMIYDATLLPYDKEFIRNACVVWMQTNRSDPGMKDWRVIFPILAQFQDGVGLMPLGIDFGAMDYEDMSEEEILEVLSRSRIPSRALSERVAREHEELRAVAERILP